MREASCTLPGGTGHSLETGLKVDLKAWVGTQDAEICCFGYKVVPPQLCLLAYNPQ